MSVASPHKSFNLMPHMDTWKACWDMSHSACDIYFFNNSSQASDLLSSNIFQSKLLRMLHCKNHFLLHFYVLFSCTNIKSFLNQDTFTWEAKRLKMLCLKPLSKINEVVFKKNCQWCKKNQLNSKGQKKQLFSHSWYIFSCFRHKLT